MFLRCQKNVSSGQNSLKEALNGVGCIWKVEVMIFHCAEYKVFVTCMPSHVKDREESSSTRQGV